MAFWGRQAGASKAKRSLSSRVRCLSTRRRGENKKPNNTPSAANGKAKLVSRSKNFPIFSLYYINGSACIKKRILGRKNRSPRRGSRLFGLKNNYLAGVDFAPAFLDFLNNPPMPFKVLFTVSTPLWATLPVVFTAPVATFPAVEAVPPTTLAGVL